MTRTNELTLDAVAEQLNDEMALELIKTLNREYSYKEILDLMEQASGITEVVEAYDEWNQDGIEEAEEELEPVYIVSEREHRIGDVTTTTFCKERASDD